MPDVMNTAPADGSNNQLTGPDSQPAPKNEGSSKYSDYYALNKESDGAGSPEGANEPTDPSIEGVKPGAKAPDAKESPAQADPQPKKEKVPDWQRRISVLTAREKSQAAEMQELRRQVAELSRSRTEGQVQQPKKLARENFLSDEEYLDHVADFKAEEKLNTKIQELQKQGEVSRESEAAHREFRSSWLQKVQSNFPREEDRREFGELLRGAKDNLHQDIHDFMQNSDVGPKMLRVLREYPDFAEALNKLPSSVRSTRLAQVEQTLYTELQQEYAAAAAAQVQAPAQRPSSAAPAQQRPRVSQAPAPTGPVGNSGGSAAPADGDDAAAVHAYNRKKFGLA